MGIVDYYIEKIASLNQGVTKFGPAPHKPVLLLSLIDYLEKHRSKENKFPMEEELFSLFSQNWNLLVRTGHTKKAQYPIRYFSSDKLGWVLIQNGKKVNSEDRSKKQLIEGRFYGRLDQMFFDFLMDSNNRLLARVVILDTYFPENHSYKLPYLVREIEEMVLAEPTAKIRKTVRVVEGYIRSSKFRKAVMRHYKETCAVSGMNVKPSGGVIEACHIVRHSVSGIDIITNGIALCANLHRAFDRGLISFDKNYKVLIKPKSKLIESESPYNFRQFEGQAILLPEERLYWPNPTFLKAHRKLHRF